MGISAGFFPSSTSAAMSPMCLPISKKLAPRSNNAPLLTDGGITVKTGIRARRQAAMTCSVAVETATSPLIHMHSAPRAMTEFTDSMTAVLFSALPSISSMPSSAQISRASLV